MFKFSCIVNFAIIGRDIAIVFSFFLASISQLLIYYLVYNIVYLLALSLILFGQNIGIFSQSFIATTCCTAVHTRSCTYVRQQLLSQQRTRLINSGKQPAANRMQHAPTLKEWVANFCLAIFSFNSYTCTAVARMNSSTTLAVISLVSPLLFLYKARGSSSLNPTRRTNHLTILIHALTGHRKCFLSFLQ